jgi:amidohydrolase
VSFLEDSRAMQGDLVQLRRTLHRAPELGLELPRTQEMVLERLDGLPLQVRTGQSLTSVVAVLRAPNPGGPTVLLRGDMDALPVREESGLDFAATGDTMHACGHDLHTTMLVGAAQLLSAHRESLAGDVVFMFQPGEEGDDGAGHMIEEGVLQASGRTPDAAFALHVMSAFVPHGVVATRPGSLMASADVLRVTVRGSGGHGSMPYRARDPIVVAAEMVTALQTMVTRRFDVFDPVVVTVGSFHAGTKNNIIPPEAYFEATVRSFSPEANAKVADVAVELCRGLARAHGLDADVSWNPLYPVTVNNAAEAAFVGDTVGELFGPERTATLDAPITGAEDFSRILQAVPGAMAFLGACPPQADPVTAPFNHSPLAVFDESVLADGTALLASLAADKLRVLAAS